MKNLSDNLHFLTLFLRGAIRNKAYSIINVIGLSLGYGVFIFSLIYVYYETHFETFHPKRDHIYRATYRYSPPSGAGSHWARIPFEYINELPNDIPGIEHLIRFQNHERKYVRVGTEKFRPDHAYVTDKEVFNVFGFNLVKGDPASALANPYSIVLTQSLANQYFGKQDAIGKEIFVIGDLDQSETTYVVTGIMQDLPTNTHLPVDMLISFKNKEERTGWAYTYILLNENTPIIKVEGAIQDFIKKHKGEEYTGRDDIHFQKLQDIHLTSHLAREIIPGGKMFYVKIVGFAGLFVLIIAVINFMNLHSAIALRKSKEIGVRKMMGAKRSQLIIYLLRESVFYHTIALVLGAICCYSVFPWLKTFVAVEFLISTFWFSLTLISLAVFCGIISGVYPVILLVGLRPLDSVRSSKSLTLIKRDEAFNFKRALIVFQVSMSVILLGSSIIAYQQFRFLNTTNLGIKKEAVLAIPNIPNGVTERIPAFKKELAGVRGIVEVAACMEVPSREIRDVGPVLVEGINMDPDNAPVVDIQVIDPDLPDLLGLEFIEGKNIPARQDTWTAPRFNEKYSLTDYLTSQQRHYLINETAVHELGWNSADEAIGQQISWSIGDIKLGFGPVTGVVKDFHQESLRNKVDPVVMVDEPIWLRTILIRMATDQVQSSLKEIQTVWDKLYPYYPMGYYFLDDLYENLYKGERVQLQLLFAFSGLAIFIALIGLLGLITYSLQIRVKELAIRKVLGATYNDLVRLMGKEYLLIVIVGSIIGVPVSLYAVDQWLADFAYHVQVSSWTYALTLMVVAILIAGIIGLQTFNASRINAADTLKDN